MGAPLAESRALVEQMARADARRLRRILSLRTSAARHRSLIAASGLPLGALLVAESFHSLCAGSRRVE